MPVVAAASGTWLALTAGGAWLALAAAYWPVVAFYRLPAIWTLTLPAVAARKWAHWALKDARKALSRLNDPVGDTS